MEKMTQIEKSVQDVLVFYSNERYGQGQNPALKICSGNILRSIFVQHVADKHMKHEMTGGQISRVPVKSCDARPIVLPQIYLNVPRRIRPRLRPAGGPRR